jgi:hypothetical protein
MDNRSILAQGIASVLAIIGIFYGGFSMTTMPDNVFRQCGLPLRWGVHQLSTIAGPVDYWRVDLTYLVLDLAIWLLIILVIPFLVNRNST